MNDVIDGMSMDIEQIERDKLRSVFPQCFSDGRLDIDKLLNLCGEYIADDFEKYEFKWKDKSEALQLAGKRSTGTLRPCREESVNWYSTGNLYIEGDNLEVLKLLQTAYFRKVKMIYIDPPYNTGNDFIYKDDFADSMARYKEITSQTTKSNPETMGRFHTNWLNMMYPRLRLAANLLRDDGVMFISIDDNEVHNLRKLCDEVLGEENFIAQIVWQKRTSPDARRTISAGHDYICVYAKNNELSKELLNQLSFSEKDLERYKNPDNDPNGPWASTDCTAQAGHGTKDQFYDLITPSGRVIHLQSGLCWRYTKKRMDEEIAAGHIWFGTEGNGVPRKKTYLSDREGKNIWTWWPNTEVGHTQEATKEVSSILGQSGVFNYPKPLRLLKRIIQISTDSNSIILDFFSGSATTAHAVMQLNAEDGGNRQFIMVQLPEFCDEKSEAYKAGYKNICEIGKERVRRVGAKLMEPNRQMKLLGDSVPPDVGFRVFKLDTSNCRMWDNSPVAEKGLFELEQRINDMIDRVKPDRSDLDMVFEIMLKLGVPITESVAAVDIDGKTAYCVRDDCRLMVCLQDGITTEMVEKMAEYAPARIIFGQNCFADVTAMSNAKLTLRDRDIEMKFV